MNSRRNGIQCWLIHCGHIVFRGSTQVTPYQLVYGHDAVLPWETNIVSRRVQLQDQLESNQYHDLMMDELEYVVQHRLYALKKIQENKARVARHYDKKVVSKSFAVGDLVWKLRLPIGLKYNRFGKCRQIGKDPS